MPKIPVKKSMWENLTQEMSIYLGCGHLHQTNDSRKCFSMEHICRICMKRFTLKISYVRVLFGWKIFGTLTFENDWTYIN